MVKDRGRDGAGSIKFAAARRNVYLHGTLGHRRAEERRRQVRAAARLGEMVTRRGLLRRRDCSVAGFEHRDDAQRFLV